MAAADTFLTGLVLSDHEIDNKDVKKPRKHKLQDIRPKNAKPHKTIRPLRQEGHRGNTKQTQFCTVSTIFLQQKQTADSDELSGRSDSGTLGRSIR